MSARNGSGWRAAAAALLLIAAGTVFGIALDRLWLAPPALHAQPMTAETLAQQLGLSASEEARLRSLLDTLHAHIGAIVEHSPEALPAAIRDAQARIEAALPAHTRDAFRDWMRVHHERMLHGGGLHGAAPHRAPHDDHGPGPR